MSRTGRCCCTPCQFCSPRATLTASGSSWQAEIAGIINPSTPPPDLEANNGTWAMQTGDTIGTLPSIMVSYAFEAGVVDYDSSWRGEKFSTLSDKSFCLVWAELDSYDPMASGGDPRIAFALLYGTTGGGLSAVVGMYSGSFWAMYENVVLSATERRIDCGAVDKTASSLTSVMWAPGGVGQPHVDPSGVSIRIVTV